MSHLRGRVDRSAPHDPEPDLTPLAATFLRGLSLGALAGAAIAGSAIWRRLRDVRDDRADGQQPEEGTPPVERA